LPFGYAQGRRELVERLRGPAPRSYKGDGEIGESCTVEVALVSSGLAPLPARLRWRSLSTIVLRR